MLTKKNPSNLFGCEFFSFRLQRTKIRREPVDFPSGLFMRRISRQGAVGMGGCYWRNAVGFLRHATGLCLGCFFFSHFIVRCLACVARIFFHRLFFKHQALSGVPADAKRVIILAREVYEGAGVDGRREG